MGQECGLPDLEGEAEGQGWGCSGLWGPPPRAPTAVGTRVAVCPGVLAVLWDCGRLQPLGSHSGPVCRAEEGAGTHGLQGHRARRGGEHERLCSVTGGILQHTS